MLQIFVAAAATKILSIFNPGSEKEKYGSVISITEPQH